MGRLDELANDLPPEMQREVEAFIESLRARLLPASQAPFALDWRGALRELKGRFTSVELQHQAMDWWSGECTS